jgi:hypothetical protein
LGQLCQRAGLGDEPRRVLAELAELRAVDVVLPTRGGKKSAPAASRSPANTNKSSSTTSSEPCPAA